MKISFSERIGLKKPKTQLLKNEMTTDLRNSLWNVFTENIIYRISNEIGFDEFGRPERYSKLAFFYQYLWRDFFKNAIDTLPIANGVVRDTDFPYSYIRQWFLNSAKWNEIYEFLECIAEYSGDSSFKESCNFYLKKELAAYRFVGNDLIEINSEEEINEINRAIGISDKFKPVKIHLSTALSRLSDKTAPDYRNSLKESISAVESLCKIIVNKDNATLGEALNIIEKTYQIPKSLKNGFGSIYGFTSDKGGIRHGMQTDDFVVSIDEARFMLIACSAFINYLISIYNK
ncbi:MAG: hypothetical protein P4L28_08550 [Paludibacteraceae bacterium]|nr:hypothetical protein [Paludibacteraceae bacterium]